MEPGLQNMIGYGGCKLINLILGIVIFGLELYVYRKVEPPNDSYLDLIFVVLGGFCILECLFSCSKFNLVTLYKPTGLIWRVACCLIFIPPAALMIYKCEKDEHRFSCQERDIDHDPKLCIIIGFRYLVSVLAFLTVITYIAVNFVDTKEIYDDVIRKLFVPDVNGPNRSKREQEVVSGLPSENIPV